MVVRRKLRFEKLPEALKAWVLQYDYTHGAQRSFLPEIPEELFTHGPERTRIDFSVQRRALLYFAGAVEVTGANGASGNGQAKQHLSHIIIAHYVVLQGERRSPPTGEERALLDMTLDAGIEAQEKIAKSCYGPLVSVCSGYSERTPRWIEERFPRLLDSDVSCRL